MGTSMKQRRVNVIFPAELVEALDQFVSPRQRNRFIVEATERALDQARLTQVLRNLRTEPAWKEVEHPDLRTPDDVDRYVRRIRETWMSRTWEEVEEEVSQSGPLSD